MLRGWSPFSRRLISSHCVSTSSASSALPSLKTWGWRRIILSLIAWITSLRVKLPSSLAMRLWRQSGQQVAGLVALLVTVSSLHGVEALIGLLDQVGLKTLHGLLLVPWAAAWIAQAIHDGDERFELFSRGRHRSLLLRDVTERSPRVNLRLRSLADRVFR